MCVCVFVFVFVFVRATPNDAHIRTIDIQLGKVQVKFDSSHSTLFYPSSCVMAEEAYNKAHGRFPT